MRKFERNRGDEIDRWKIGVDEGVIVIERGNARGSKRDVIEADNPLQKVNELIRRKEFEGFVETVNEIDIWDSIPENFKLFGCESVEELHDTAQVIASFRPSFPFLVLLTIGSLGAINIWNHKNTKVTNRFGKMTKYIKNLGLPSKSVILCDMHYQNVKMKNDPELMEDILIGGIDYALGVQRPGIGRVILTLQMPIIMGSYLYVDEPVSDWMYRFLEDWEEACIYNPAVKLPEVVNTRISQVRDTGREFYAYSPNLKIGNEAYSKDGESIFLDGAWRSTC